MTRYLAILLAMALPLSAATTYYVATNGLDANPGTEAEPFLSLQHALNTATTAGDKILMGAGQYPGGAETTASGSAGSPIVIDGQNGATIPTLWSTHSYVSLVNMKLVATNTALGQNLVWIRRDSHHFTLSNCIVDGVFIKASKPLIWEAPTDVPFGADAASGCVIISNTFTHAIANPVVDMMGYFNEFRGNKVIDSCKPDFIRLAGRSNHIAFNLCSNAFNSLTIGNHTDFLQSSATAGIGSMDHIIEGNVVVDIPDGQIMQNSIDGMAHIMGNWIVKNNIFINIGAQASVGIPNVRFYNNLFYKCGTGTVLANGSRGLAISNAPSGTIAVPTNSNPEFVYRVESALGGAANYITYNGTNFDDNDEFIGATGVTTYTATGDAELWYKRYDYPHGGQCYNNIFLNCHTQNSTNANGKYYYNTYLTNVGADYNFIANINTNTGSPYSMFREDPDHRPVGNPAPDYWDISYWWENNGINGGNPHFVDEGHRNFHLSFASPLVGTGTNLSAIFTNDFEGNIRTSWDIGPFAFIPDTNAYYVTTNGNNGASGLYGAPWLTVQKAATTLTQGQTVVIGPGDYYEYPDVAHAGVSGSPITYRAASRGFTSMRGFRIRYPFITLDGLKLNRFSGVGETTGSAVYIDDDAHNATITNCWISDAPLSIGHDFRFDDADNEIISASANFATVGFTNGSKILLGASSLSPYWYSNHQTAWIVASNTQTSLWCTNAAGDSFLPDPGSNYWCVVRPDGDSYGVYTPAPGASNILIAGNTFSNWAGHCWRISYMSHGTKVVNNLATELHAFLFGYYDASEIIISNNIIRYSPNLLHYSGDEINIFAGQPGDWHDFQYAMTRGEAGTTNERIHTYFERNWFEDIQNQMGRIDDTNALTYDVRFRNNIFMGLSAHFSGGRDGMHWISNTFYRAAYGSANPLSIGSRAGYPPHTNYILMGNMFVDCASADLRAQSGYYGVTNSTDPLVNSNFVSQGEITGWAAKDDFSEVNGVNGGDPGFLSVLDPDGIDNIPWTSDDGLLVLPNSAAAVVGGGGCGIYVVVTNLPVAHFWVSNTNGWFENEGTNYNPTWWTNSPTMRTNEVRPWQTPQLLATALPATVTFDASHSISGIGGAITNTGMTNYQWVFGDGVYHSEWVQFGAGGLTFWTNSPVVSYTYEYLTNTPGTNGAVMVQLMVYNSLDNSHTSSNLYLLEDSTADTLAVLSISPTSRTLSCLTNTDAAATSYNLANSGDTTQTINYTNTQAGTWFTMSLTNGSVSTETDTNAITFSTGALAAGNYTGYVTNKGYTNGVFLGSNIFTINLSVTNGVAPPAGTNTLQKVTLRGARVTTRGGVTFR